MSLFLSCSDQQVALPIMKVRFNESESDDRAGDFALRRSLDVLGPLLTANLSWHFLLRPLEACGGSSGGCHEEAAATLRAMDASNELPP